MAIVIKDNKVEVFEVADGELKLTKVVGSAPAVEDASKKDKLELYKMEYERCALRYDDLYKAAWTNFSYMAVISGAILTFGSASFMPQLSIFVATLPLLFWWIASFEPLNRYGDQVQARAACIEKLINELVGLGKTEDLCDQQKEARERQRGLRHFQDFEKRHFKIKWSHLVPVILFWTAVLSIVLQNLFDLSKTILWLIPVGSIFLIVWLILKYKDSPTDTPNRFWQHMLRVRLIVRAFAGTIIIVATCSAYGAYQHHQPRIMNPTLRLLS